MIKPADLIAKFKKALQEKWGYIWGTAGVLWTKAKQDELNKTTDESREMGRKYGAKWIGHMVADCSGLFSWAFKQLGGYMYHGSNTMWDKYCSAKGELSNGKRTDGKTLRPGTAVFTYNKTKKNRGHVGLYIGDGWVIEAQGTKAGVVKSSITLAKWVEWGELKGVDYGADSSSNGDSAASTPANNVLPVDAEPTLKMGMKGEYVTILQTKLKNKGYDLGKYGVDGSFGNATLAAVKAFQKDHGLTVDGIVGANTWKALSKADTSAVYYTVTIPHLTLQQANAVVSQYKDAYKTEERR